MDDLRQSYMLQTRGAGGKENLSNRNKDPIKKGDARNRIKDLDQLEVRIRPADEGDNNLIYSSWLKSYAGLNKDIPRLVTFKIHAPVVQRILERSITLVACDKHDGENVYAWLTAERKPKFLILHFAYTKAAFRRWGLQKALAAAFDYKRGEQIMSSHRSHIFKKLRSRGHNVLHVPHLQHPEGAEHVSIAYGLQK